MDISKNYHKPITDTANLQSVFRPKLKNGSVSCQDLDQL